MTPRLAPLLLMVCAQACLAREGRQDPRFVPEQVDTSKLHPRSTLQRESRPLYERVEQDVARGERRGNTVQPSQRIYERPRGIVVEPPEQMIESTLTRYVREQANLLDAARLRYQESLRQAEVERDNAVAADRSNRAAKSLAASRFDEKRLQLTRTYQAECQKILGNTE